MWIVEKVKKWLQIDVIKKQNEEQREVSKAIMMQLERLTQQVVNSKSDGKCDSPQVVEEEHGDVMQQQQLVVQLQTTIADMIEERKRLELDKIRAVEEAKANAIKEWMENAGKSLKNEANEERGKGRPKVEGTKISLLVRQDNHDRLLVLKKTVPSFNTSRFINESITEKLEVVFVDHPEWMRLE